VLDSGAAAVTVFLDTTTANAVLVAAVLPSSRSVRVGVPATAFATIINTGATTATGCTLGLNRGPPAAFSFQSTNPATNQVPGTHNAPADIPPGAARPFVLAFTAAAPIAPIDVALTFACANQETASTLVGLNTLLLSASAAVVPDIVALAATLNGDGIVN